VKSAAAGSHGRLTAEEMDEQRLQNVAYHYLCRLEEAKRWMEACLGEELPAPTELEEALRNGVILAKLGHRFAPSVVSRKKIYDWEQLRYKAVGVEFRHTDNINHWRNAMMSLGLPSIFHPETTDIYDKKNMPRAVYCIHALSLYLYRRGLAPQITDLCGKVKFTVEEINNMRLELDKYGLQLPAFHKIGGILSNELSVDEAAVHAAVIAINEAVESRDVGATAEALRNPNAQLTDLQEALMSVYQAKLYQAKQRKEQQAAKQHQLEAWPVLMLATASAVRWAVEQVDEAVEAADEKALAYALRLPCLALTDVLGANGRCYLERLAAERDAKALVCHGLEPLEPDELQDVIHMANWEACADAKTLDGVNQSLRGSDPQHTVSCLMSSDLQLPTVFPCGASLYHKQLQLLQTHAAQGVLQQEELFVAVEMLSAVVLVNQAVEERNLQQLSSLLASSVRHKYHMRSSDNHLNACMTSDPLEILALQAVNEALMSGDAHRLLSALLLPSSGVEDILPANSYRYLHLMNAARQLKAQVNPHIHPHAHARTHTHFDGQSEVNQSRSSFCV
uniref:Calponin-homology (CH) domain-containing protein n=1 Tax=Hippocampus comes TaxID=109280 RepID=A0A3Q3DDK8_HIPCM